MSILLILIDELLSKCFKLVLIFKVTFIIIKHVYGAMQSCHFRTLGYRMVVVYISSFGLNVAILAAGPGALISAARTSPPWLETSPGLKASLAEAGSSTEACTWTRSIRVLVLISNSSFFLVWAVIG